ncbi:hypothetical protein MMC19_003144 [Ptychographa xylographoides]|nr:hypothetical protein [Ptychographa xylographoides]
MESTDTVGDTSEHPQTQQLNTRSYSQPERKSLTPKSTRLLSLAERYGGIDELEKLLEASGDTLGTLMSNVSQNPPPVPTSNAQTSSEQIGIASQSQQPTPVSFASRRASADQSFLLEGSTMVAKPLPLDPMADGLQAFLPLLLTRLDVARANQVSAMAGPLEESRLRLLYNACEINDISYLALHQLFCVCDLPKYPVEHFALNSNHLFGLKKLTELVLPNMGLSSEAAKWLSAFPRPMHNLLEASQTYYRAYWRAKNFLEVFAQKWDPFKRLCIARRSPPLVDYMETELGVKSRVLQIVIHTAIQRVLWVGEQDLCFQQSVALFSKNQKKSQEWELQRGSGKPPSKDEMTLYYQGIIAVYQQIYNHHLQHVQQGRNFDNGLPQSRNMRPPLQSQENHTIRTIQMAQANMLRSNSVNDRAIATDARTAAPALIALQDRFHQQRQASSARTAIAIPSTSLIPPVVPTGMPQFHPRVDSGNHARNYVRHVSMNTQTGTTTVSQPSVLSTSNAYSVRQSRPTAITTSSRGASSGSSTPLQSPVISSPLQGSSDPRSRIVQQASDRTHQVVTSLQNNTALTPLQSNQIWRYPLTQDNNNAATTALPSPGLQRQIISSYPRTNNSSPSRLQEGLPIPAQIQPSTDNSALHQAHLREPELLLTDCDSNIQGETGYFQFVRELAGTPSLVNSGARNVYNKFHVSEAALQTIPQDLRLPFGAPSQRKIRNGSRMFRFRCIQWSVSACPTESQFFTNETIWPSNIAVTFNEACVELRRKVHHGKDMPVDLTNMIKEGTNSLHMAILRTDQATKAESLYAFGVEIIEVANLKTVKGMARHIDETKMQQRLDQQVSNQNSDVVVLTRDISIDVVDPFSSSLIKTPARGASCRHYECFDLDNFLQTRHGNLKGPPCRPERFRCPICNGDARPQSLVIDEWFVRVLEELRRLGRPDVRSIVLEGTGAWRIKEDEILGESGDGTGKRNEHMEARDVPQKKQNEVIEID